jgi:hypothetical protein
MRGQRITPTNLKAGKEAVQAQDEAKALLKPPLHRDRNGIGE